MYEFWFGILKIVFVLNSSNVICDGNSLTLGTAGPNPGKSYPELLADSINSIGSIYNKGIDSDYGSNMLLNFNADIKPLIKVDTSNLYICWEITNDLYFGSTSQEAVNNVLSLCDSAKAQGMTVMVINSLPRNQTKQAGGTIAEYNNDLDLANTLLLDQYFGHADMFVNCRWTSELQDPTDTNYFIDGIHLNEDGYALLVQEIKRVLMEYIE